MGNPPFPGIFFWFSPWRFRSLAMWVWMPRSMASHRWKTQDVDEIPPLESTVIILVRLYLHLPICWFLEIKKSRIQHGYFNTKSWSSMTWMIWGSVWKPPCIHKKTLVGLVVDQLGKLGGPFQHGWKVRSSSRGTTYEGFLKLLVPLNHLWDLSL